MPPAGGLVVIRPGVLRGLDLRRVRRHVGVNQGRRALHVVLHLVFLVFDDLLLHLAAAPASGAAALLLLGRGRLVEGNLLHLAVCAVVAAVLLAALLLALHADDGRLDPLVLPELGESLLHRLLEGRYLVLCARPAGLGRRLLSVNPTAAPSPAVMASAAGNSLPCHGGDPFSCVTSVEAYIRLGLCASLWRPLSIQPDQSRRLFQLVVRRSAGLFPLRLQRLPRQFRIDARHGVELRQMNLPGQLLQEV